MSTTETTPGWTDDLVEVLKRLWHNGLSASQIADELGEGFTRNSVIGKVHRLKLPSRPKSFRAERKPKPKPPEKPRPAIAATPSRHPPPRPIHHPVIAREFIAAPAPVVEEVYVPPENRIGVLQLTERTCKWPIGDPLQPDFHFCGRHTLDGKPYCSEHARRAFVPAPPIKLNGKRR